MADNSNADRENEANMKSITITLPLPPSINASYRVGNGRFYQSEEAKQWLADAYILLRQQWKEPPTKARIGLVIRWYFKREADISNRLKIVEDAMQRVIYENDKQIYQEVQFKFYDKVNPRVEIVPEEMFT